MLEIKKWKRTLLSSLKKKDDIDASIIHKNALKVLVEVYKTKNHVKMKGVLNMHMTLCASVYYINILNFS